MHAAFIAALAGLGTGLSLIVAIGAQNAFVLRQGIRREHVAAIVAICALSDAVLIAVGVLWFGGLGFGARLLRRPFAKPGSWRVLDAVIACTMITLGVLMALRT